jgi:uncharacterized membrane protein YphA (DoxX/SURF4 family)
MFLLGRILYGGMLAIMASAHFFQTKNLAQYAAMKKTPMPTFAVLGSGAFLLAGALSILFGYYTELGVVCLTVFFLPTTVMMHNFWADKDPMMKQTNMAMFLKNSIIMGAGWMFLALPTKRGAMRSRRDGAAAIAARARSWETHPGPPHKAQGLSRVDPAP